MVAITWSPSCQRSRPGVDEHAGQLVADGPVQQRGHHGGVHATGEAQQHVVAAHLLAHAGDLVLDDLGGGPQRLAAADLGDETLEQVGALLGMGHFRMELHAVPALVLVLHHRDRDAVGGAGDDEARRRLGDVVAMAHPHVQTVHAVVVAQLREQAALGDDIHFGVTELARVGGLGGAAQLRGQGLHAVADAEDRQA